jgi:hypothetical protein
MCEVAGATRQSLHRGDQRGVGAGGRNVGDGGERDALAERGGEGVAAQVGLVPARRERGEQRGARDRGGDHTDACGARRVMHAALVEDRPQPHLELGPRGHRQSGCGAAADQRARDVDERRRIRVGRDAFCEHGVIAGLFARECCLMRRDPRQRVEPVDGADGVADRGLQKVAACDMRALVQEHGAEACGVPLFGGARQENARAEGDGLLDLVTQEHVRGETLRATHERGRAGERHDTFRGDDDEAEEPDDGHEVARGGRWLRRDRQRSGGDGGMCDGRGARQRHVRDVDVHVRHDERE